MFAAKDLFMNEHCFFDGELALREDIFLLSAEEAFHAFHVLRLKTGDTVMLFNGKGLLAKALITRIDKKACAVKIIETNAIIPDQHKSVLCFSPLKRREKNEWILEKATEIGVSEIYLFISEHTERTLLNYERLEKIVLSAAKQSMNPYLPLIHPLIPLSDLITKSRSIIAEKYIAWCGAALEQHLSGYLDKKGSNMILIGPEGGFAKEEVQMAVDNGFAMVSLGKTRLRTETACVFAAVLMKTGLCDMQAAILFPDNNNTIM
jgi:16S rRNA (uracil1498-N3)-methyltransferase